MIDACLSKLAIAGQSTVIINDHSLSKQLPHRFTTKISPLLCTILI